MQLNSKISKAHEAANKRLSKYLAKRPHRSFKITRKRDYKRELKLPGYMLLAMETISELFKNKKHFLLVALVYILAIIVIGGMASQEMYDTLAQFFNETKGELFSGFLGDLSGAGLLFASLISGGIFQQLTSEQQFYMIVLTMAAILVIIWSLRNLRAGKKITLQDALYNSASPIIAMIPIFVLMIFQMVPFLVAVVVYRSAESTGLLAGGIEAMLFWIFAGMMTSLSLYWLVGSYVALMITTLPGMYPSRAIKMAGEIIIGRRLRIITRVGFMFLFALSFWVVILVPFILLDQAVKSAISDLSWLPTIPTVALLLIAMTVIWFGSYSYVLYRRIVDNE